MTDRDMPRLATILLHGFGPSDDALWGDLAEEWRTGRSAWWYWRQVLAAVARHCVAELREHWVIAVRAILTGIVVLALLEPLVRMVGPQTTRWLSGSIPGSVYMKFQLSSVLGLVTWCLSCMVAGWIVARFHRLHRAAAIFSCCLTMVSPVVTDVRLHSLIANSLTHERYLPYLVIHALAYVVGVAGLMMGGLVDAARHASANRYRVP